jgi:aspartate/methionine/tyrosine aminotransferase
VKPTYQRLPSVPEALGATVKYLHLREEDGYLPGVDELRVSVDDRTRDIVLNNSNNPTGALMDDALLREIVAVAPERGAWIHHDEAYRKLEDEPGTTSPSIVDLHGKGVSSGSMSKTRSLAGLRTGWVAGPPEVIERCLEVRDCTTISCGVLDEVPATVASSASTPSSSAASRSCAATWRSSTSGSGANRGSTTCGRAPAPRR